MKNSKKLIALLLGACMPITMFVGCGKSDKKGAEGTKVSNSSYNGKDNFKVAKKPTTLSIFFAYNPALGKAGAIGPDLPVFKEIQKITNVKIDNIANESITDATQSMNTMLAAGDLPDVIYGNTSLLHTLKSQGVFIELDDLIDKYAPNIKKFFKDYPDAEAASKGADGKMYTVTGSMSGEPDKELPSVGFFVRQDWLDKLGLDQPKTWEDYKKVLYAFHEKDPNGNGKPDEVPYFTRENNKGIYALLQFWGITDGWMVDDKTGKVEFGKVTDSYKDAIKELAQWYADGVIDPEIYTRGAQARESLLGSDIGGSTCDWFTTTGKIADEVSKKVPGMNFTVIAPPENTDGVSQSMYGIDSIHTTSCGISSSCKDPVTAIKYLDFFLSDKGSTLSSYGREGTDYTVKDGQKVPTEKALDYKDGYPIYLRDIGAGWEVNYYGYQSANVLSMSEKAREGYDLYNSDKVQIKKGFPQLLFTEEERKVIDANMTNIQANIDEYEQSCMMGKLDVEKSWDKHVAELEKMKFDEVLKVYNDAYTRYKKLS